MSGSVDERSSDGKIKELRSSELEEGPPPVFLFGHLFCARVVIGESQPRQDEYQKLRTKFPVLKLYEETLEQTEQRGVFLCHRVSRVRLSP